MTEIHSPRARALQQRVRGEAPPEPPPRPQHARHFCLSKPEECEHYERLYALRLIGKINVIKSKSKFSADGKYWAFVKWEETAGIKSDLPPELVRIFTREKRTFSVRVFDMAKDSEAAEAVMNDHDSKVFHEQGRFLDDGRYMLALHWYHSELISGEEAQEEDEPQQPKKKRKRRRGRGRRRRKIMDLAMADASMPGADPLAGLPGPP